MNRAASEAGTTKSRSHPERLREEVRHFLILFLYLWILFGLFVLNQQIVHMQEGNAMVFHGLAVLNALVLAKVMLLFEDIEVARLLKGWAAIWVILFEAALCTLLFICFHVIERYAVDFFRGDKPGSGLSIGGGGFAGVMIVGAIIFVSLLPFFAFKNVNRAIGWNRMKEILFGQPASHA